MFAATRWQTENDAERAEHLVRRLLLVFVVICGVMTSFCLQRFAWIALLCCVDACGGTAHAAPAQADRPMLLQYAAFLLNVRGVSILEVRRAGWAWPGGAPAPAELTFSALAFGLLFAVPLGRSAATDSGWTLWQRRRSVNRCRCWLGLC